MAEKLLKLRCLEINDSVTIITSEFQKHLDILKGDYLKQIISKINKLKDKISFCEFNPVNCIYTRDVSKNWLYEICKEVMKTFSTLLKQL